MMKQCVQKALYEEPVTTSEQVVLEGFICASIQEANFGVKVDELTNVNADKAYGETFEYDF